MASRDGNVVTSPARWLETGRRSNRLITPESGRPAKIEIEYAPHGSGQVQQIVLPQGHVAIVKGSNHSPVFA